MTSSQPAPRRRFLPPARSSAWCAATVVDVDQQRARDGDASRSSPTISACPPGRAAGSCTSVGASRRARRARRRTRARAASAATPPRRRAPECGVEDEAPRQPASASPGATSCPRAGPGRRRRTRRRGRGRRRRTSCASGAAARALRLRRRWPARSRAASRSLGRLKKFDADRGRSALRCDLRIQSGTAVQPPPSRRTMEPRSCRPHWRSVCPSRRRAPSRCGGPSTPSSPSSRAFPGLRLAADIERRTAGADGIYALRTIPPGATVRSLRGRRHQAAEYMDGELGLRPRGPRRERPFMRDAQDRAVELVPLRTTASAAPTSRRADTGCFVYFEAARDIAPGEELLIDCAPRARRRARKLRHNCASSRQRRRPRSLPRRWRTSTGRAGIGRKAQHLQPSTLYRRMLVDYAGRVECGRVSVWVWVAASRCASWILIVETFASASVFAASRSRARPRRCSRASARSLGRDPTAAGADPARAALALDLSRARSTVGSAPTAAETLLDPRFLVVWRNPLAAQAKSCAGGRQAAAGQRATRPGTMASDAAAALLARAQGSLPLDDATTARTHPRTHAELSIT